MIDKVLTIPLEKVIARQAKTHLTQAQLERWQKRRARGLWSFLGRAILGFGILFFLASSGMFYLVGALDGIGSAGLGIFGLLYLMVCLFGGVGFGVKLWSVNESAYIYTLLENRTFGQALPLLEALQRRKKYAGDKNIQAMIDQIRSFERATHAYIATHKKLPELVLCPHCGQELALEEDERTSLTFECPDCGQQADMSGLTQATSLTQDPLSGG